MRRLIYLIYKSVLKIQPPRSSWGLHVHRAPDRIQGSRLCHADNACSARMGERRKRPCLVSPGRDLSVRPGRGRTHDRGNLHGTTGALDCSALSFGQRASVCLSHPISSPLLFHVTSPSGLASRGNIFSQRHKALSVSTSNSSSSSLLSSLHFSFAGEVSILCTTPLGEKVRLDEANHNRSNTVLFSFHFLFLK